MRLPRRDKRLAGDASLRILRQNRVENAVRDLISEFIRMSFSDRLGCKEHLFHSKTSLRFEYHFRKPHSTPAKKPPF